MWAKPQIKSIGYMAESLKAPMLSLICVVFVTYAAVICAISLVLLWIFGVEPVIINLGLVVIMCILAQRLCLNKGVKNLEKTES